MLCASDETGGYRLQQLTAVFAISKNQFENSPVSVTVTV